MSDMNQPPDPPAYGGSPYGQPSQPPEPLVAPPGSDRYNVLAIISLITAFFISVAAVITGHIALVQIKRTGEKGRSLAIAGLVLGYAGILFGIIGTIILVLALIAGTAQAARNKAALDAANNYFSSVSPSDLPSDQPSDQPSDDTTTAPTGDLTFAAGAQLQPSNDAIFGETLALDSGWAVKTPDTGTGSWSYTSSDKACTVKFYEGDLGSTVSVVTGDDLATTDNFLTYVDNQTAADEAQYATTSAIDYQYSGSGDSVQTRVLNGTDNDGTQWITSARAFTGLQQGMYVDVSCQPSSDVVSIYHDVLAETSITVD